ncbi:MAG TPA: MMPL family transporter [Geopsychrobacteraceae bacterium]|nr:MMPL family transporter [Geopsychrobacteraceae bacterium]
MTESLTVCSLSIDKLLRWLVGKGRLPSLTAVLVVTLFLAYFAVQVSVESNNSSMVSQDRELQENYDSFRETFGNDETLLLAITHPQLLQAEGLQTIDRLTQQLSHLEGVTRVFSLTNAEQITAGDFGAETSFIIPKPYENDQQPESIVDAFEHNPDLSRLLLAKDQHTATLIIDLADEPEAQERGLAAIDELLATAYNNVDWHLTGIPLQKMTVSRLIQRDQQVVIPFSAIVLGALLILMFRRISGLVLPLLVMSISLGWTIGIYSLCGYSLNTITALLPPVIMVLSISTTVHLYSGWLQLSGQQGDAKQLLVRELHQLFLPCLFTALTTALGLVSLTVSDVPAVQLFGIFSAIGVMLSFVVNILLVPTLLSFLSLPISGRRLYDAGMLRTLLQIAAKLTVVRPRSVVIMALILALGALGGLSRIDNNTDLVRFLKPTEKLHSDTMFIEQAVGGVNSLEFMLVRTDGKALTHLDDMVRLDKLQSSVDELPQVTGSYSLLSLLKQLNRAETSQPQLTLPDTPGDLLYLFDLLEVAPDQDLLRKMISSDYTRLRLSVRTRAIGTAEAAILVADIEQLAEQELGGRFDLRPTGDYYQVIVDSNRLVSNVVSSFSLSLGMVLLAIFILFRSFKLLSMALIPNLIPLAWTGGLMGYLDIDLSTGTAMIAAVVIGLTVDSTIHYLARFQRVYQGSSKDAVMGTTIATGRALTVSALVLFFGFSVGGLSSFLPTIYFSLLTGVTMLGALVCDLLVLPASLVLYGLKWESEVL